MEVAAVKLTDKAKRDYLLVQNALHHGDQKAYAKLMQLYREPVYYMLLKMINSPYDAEDLTIEAFGKAFKNLDKYTDNYAFSTWLFKVAVNNCIDYIRKRNCSPQCVDEGIFSSENSLCELNSPYEHTPEDTIIEKQKIKMMHLAVEQLRPKYRTLIEMRYFEELSYDEIAKELNISLSNVKILLFRAKDMLAAIMKNMRHSI
jgi:RNA polymerase sigma factor, sigma-70 family